MSEEYQRLPGPVKGDLVPGSGDRHEGQALVDLAPSSDLQHPGIMEDVGTLLHGGAVWTPERLLGFALRTPTFPSTYQGYQLTRVGSLRALMEYLVAVTGTTESVSPLQNGRIWWPWRGNQIETRRPLLFPGLNLVFIGNERAKS